MKKEMFLPAAIVFAGVVISIAILSTHYHPANTQDGNPALTRPVSAADHVFGDPAAPVVLIEYADIDSEYSKDFQSIMEQVMQNYGATGNVAWVYRDFPIVSQDPNSEEDAEAAECAGSIGQPSNFFGFIDAFDTAAPGDSDFDPTTYDSVVSSMGLSTGSFDDCMSAHTYQQKVASDLANAELIGASGSPYSVLEVKGQKPVVISGSVPYDTMKQVLDSSIQKALSQN